jgi:hypothetical protein
VVPIIEESPVSSGKGYVDTCSSSASNREDVADLEVWITVGLWLRKLKPRKNQQQSKGKEPAQPRVITLAEQLKEAQATTLYLDNAEVRLLQIF